MAEEVQEPEPQGHSPQSQEPVGEEVVKRTQHLCVVPQFEPFLRRTPPNCFFEVDDFETEWLYHKPFDFIHGRELEGCIKDENKLFERALDHLIPGGFIELQASSAHFTSDDGTLEKATYTKIWLGALHEALKEFGKLLDIATGWREKLEKAGFVDVHEKVIKLPVGIWPKDQKLKELGRLQQFQQIQAVDTYTPVIGKVLGWDHEQRK